ncbi:MAG: MBL fold metallo-hydrolase [Anaerolineae bacterium]|nr:MBL fold metallo-hydrolase [Anaerolineae bacterium]
MIQIGDIRIHLINDCDIMVDPGGAFGLVPRALWSPLLPPDEDHLVPMVQNCVLIQTGGMTIIADTGYGTRLSDKQMAFMKLKRPRGGVLDGLARLGLRAEDIQLVINTHLHNDHCGGNTYFDAEGRVCPTFPNAEHVVQRREYEDATHPNERTRATYIQENHVPLLENGQLRLLDGDTDLAPGVRTVVTPGHTPGHMSVLIESNGEHAMFVCDLASYAIHFERLGWMTGYDVEPLITLESKRIWQRWALESNAVLIFPHDSQRPAGRYVQAEDGKARVVKLDEPFA